MGLPWNVNASMGGAGVNDQILRSLRFRSSASAYLSRTPSVAGSSTKYTFSAWIKRGASGGAAVFEAGYSTAPWLYIGFSNDNMYLSYTAGVSGTGQMISTAVYRDFSSWYHMVWAIDTTQATSSDRIKMYVNGVQVTSFSQATYPSLNQSLIANTTVAHQIGGYSGQFFDGYLAEINFIDGQQLTPASFGYNDPVTGVWQPAPFKGTYGTNGFYLPFTDIATTSGSNFGLGRDYSGNSNYWNTNNISVTSGATYDSMIDSPTNFSDGTGIYNRGNYPTWNPLDKDGGFSTSNGNLTLTASSAARARTTMTIPTGLWYVEINLTSLNNGGTVGIIPQSNNLGAAGGSNDIGTNSTEYGVFIQSANGDKYNNGSRTSYGGAWATGNVIMIALDFSGADGSKKIYFGNNGNWANGSGSWNQAWATASAAFSTISGSNYVIAAGQGGGTTQTLDINYGQRPFSYTPPTGYKALNTFNLPTPTVVNGASYMAATLYTGNNGTNNISTATNNAISATFQPDLAWLKCRSSAEANTLVDSVRGNNLVLISSPTGTGSPTGTAVERTGSYNNGYNNIALSSTGVQITNPTAQNDETNLTGRTYVGWLWKGGGTAVTNTSGSITSSVSASAQSGCSIVTYTGTGSAATVGHGLGAAPSMIIVKCRTLAIDWIVYHISNGNNAFITLNNASTLTTGASYMWNSTSPTSSVFSINTDAGANSARPYVAYCFAPIRGYSAFGNYTGNGGGTNGVFVYTGFRPRYVLIKGTQIATEWLIMDTSRNPYNSANYRLDAQSASAEQTIVYLDILSNGFKMVNPSSYMNDSGSNFIWAAFAENPFNYSRAR